MNPIKNPIVHFSLAMLCAGLAGCMTPNPVVPLGGGYEEKGHPNQSSPAPADTRVSFQYRAPDGKITLIWPSLYGVGEVIKGDVAIFVGDKAYVQPDADNPRGTKPRLFAVRSPGLPLDITGSIMAVVKTIRKRLRENFGPVQPGDPGGKERPVGSATGILDRRKRLAGYEHASIGLESSVRHHARCEGEWRHAQGFAMGHELH